MRFEHFIAKRYLFAKHHVNFITIISYLSVTGISIGVAALIVVLSVFNGFQNLVTSYLISFDPDVRIEAATDAAQVKLSGLYSQFKQKGYVYVTPFIKSKALLTNGGYSQTVDIKGIDFTSRNVRNIFENKILLGEIFFPTESSQNQILLGAYLADRLQVTVGDTLHFFSPNDAERLIANPLAYQTKKVIVHGIFLSNNNDYDATLAFLPLQTAQQIFNYKNNYDGIELKLNNANDAFDVKMQLEKVLANNFSISTWYDFHKDLYSVMNIERWVAYALLLMIIAVAVFNILGSLSMSVVEKRREIGVLKVKGVTGSSIKKIFLLQGFYIGVIGTLTGFLLGGIIYYLQVTYKFYPLNPLEYKIDALPMKLEFWDFLTIGGASILLSTFASFIPAKKAAQINPVESIKWE